MSRLDDLLSLQRHDPDVKMVVNRVVAGSGCLNAMDLSIKQPEVFDELCEAVFGMVVELPEGGPA